MNELTIELQGEQVWLLPERALFWPRTGTLLVADAHLGKDTTFRAAGIPIPDATAETLATLSQALRRTSAERLIFLGDLVHARKGLDAVTVDAVATWRAQHQQCSMLLVTGNHDARSGALPAVWQIEDAGEQLPETPFVFQHHPAASPYGYALAGHLHPAVRLVGLGKQKERLACFWLRETYGVLPAFGTFTGAFTVTPTTKDRLFVIAHDSVVAVTQ